MITSRLDPRSVALEATADHRAELVATPDEFPHPIPATAVFWVQDNVDRSAHLTAHGFSREHRLPTVELICHCGWRSAPIATPPGTRYVTHTQPDAGSLWAILPEAFWRRCEDMLHAHAPALGSHPLRANYMNFSRVSSPRT